MSHEAVAVRIFFFWLLAAMLSSSSPGLWPCRLLRRFPLRLAAGSQSRPEGSWWRYPERPSDGNPFWSAETLMIPLKACQSCLSHTRRHPHQRRWAAESDSFWAQRTPSCLFLSLQQQQQILRHSLPPPFTPYSVLYSISAAHLHNPMLLPVCDTYWLSEQNVSRAHSGLACS